MYSAGTTLRLNLGTFFHYGIADGVGGVIHNSKKWGKVTHESEIGFADGRQIEVGEISSAVPEKAIQIAKRYLGLPYNLIDSNCEHFVRLCHGLEIESTQIQQYLMVALGAGMALKSDNSLIKVAGGAAAIASLLTPTEKSPFKYAAVAALVAVGMAVLARA